MTLLGVDVVAVEAFAMTTVTLVGALAGLGVAYVRKDVPDEFANADDEVTLDPPNIKESLFAPLATYFHLRKQRKLAGKGYVKWFLVDDGWPRPKFIKPKDKGGGQFEYEHDGETYLFPREAMLPSKDEGMWTVVHDHGDATPRNLRQPTEFTVSAKQLNNYVTSRVTVEPPGWLSGLSDMSAQDLFKYAIMAFIAFVLLQGAMGGGLP